MATKTELLKKSQQAIGDYIKLSAYLFGEDAPQDVNEIPKNNPFFKDIKEIAEEMELDWEKMSHSDSNRVMLNILAEYFCRIQQDENYHHQITVTFVPKS